MKLVVCSTHDQARNLTAEYPADIVVVEGSITIRGNRYTEIVDRTYEPHRHPQWWEEVQARLEAGSGPISPPDGG